MQLLALLFSFVFSASADQGPHFSQLNCESFNGEISVVAQSQPCMDARYSKWNHNGCYHISANRQGTSFLETEMIRDFAYRESQQGFYALYSYDKDEWVLNGMIIRLQPNSNGRHEFRLDQRGSSRQKMDVVARGFCEVIN